MLPVKTKCEIHWIHPRIRPSNTFRSPETKGGMERWEVGAGSSWRKDCGWNHSDEEVPVTVFDERMSQTCILWGWNSGRGADGSTPTCSPALPWPPWRLLTALSHWIYSHSQRVCVSRRTTASASVFIDIKAGVFGSLTTVWRLSSSCMLSFWIL